MFIQRQLIQANNVTVHSTARGKGRENVITINQSLFSQNSTHVHSKTTYSLLIEQFTVQSSGGKEEEIQIIIHHTIVYVSSAHPPVHTKVLAQG